MTNSLTYKDENFSLDENKEFEDFIKWCSLQGAKCITISSEQNPMCDIGNEHKKVTNKILSNDEVIRIINKFISKDSFDSLKKGKMAEIIWIINKNTDFIYSVGIGSLIYNNKIGYEIIIHKNDENLYK